MRRCAFLILLALPTPAAAHAAFGDLGPFYANLLHPLADPVQAVLLAGFAALLARQPMSVVRPGYALHAITAAAGVVLVATVALPAPGAAAIAAVAVCLGLAALLGPRLPAAAIMALGMSSAALAALEIEPAAGLRQAILGILGGALGLATLALFMWSLFDFLRRRVGDIACMVAGSWIAAIGVMTAALPR